MRLGEVIEWITDQPEGEVTVHFGRSGGRQFDSRLRYLDESATPYTEQETTK